MPGTSGSKKKNEPTPKAPAKKAAPAKAVPTSPTYGLGLATKAMELDLPSGNQCLAIRPGAQGLIKAGLLDSLDQLTSIVQSELIDPHDPKKAVQSGVNKLALDPERLLEGLEMIDKTISFVLREPRVYVDVQETDDKGKPVFREIEVNGKTLRKPVYEPRKKDVLYADDVDLEDKMFIFQWCVGGTSDLATFRAQSAELMGNIPAS